MFFAYRDFTAEPDDLLEKINFGRAHHRVIYFVGKKKEITIKELLKVLNITKRGFMNKLKIENIIIKNLGAQNEK